MAEPSTPRAEPATPEGMSIPTPETTHKRHLNGSPLGSPLEKPLFQQQGSPVAGAATPAPSSPPGEADHPQLSTSFTSSPEKISKLMPGRLLSSSPSRTQPTSPLPRPIVMPASVTPGKSTRYPASPHHVRPWQSARAPSGPLSLGLSRTSVPPLPLQTFFLSKEDALAAPDDQLRPKLVQAVDELSMYERAARQFRSLANNYLLQNKLLTIETHENAQRHEVENNLAKREVERLAEGANAQNEATMDAETLRRRLKRSRQRLKDLEQVVTDKDNEIVTLRRQLREMTLAPPSALSSRPHSAHPGMNGDTHSSPLTINTQLARQANPYDREPLSGLDLLANHVLSAGHSSLTQSLNPSLNLHNQSQSLNQNLNLNHSRRGSSSSTISAHSEDETLEDIE